MNILQENDHARLAYHPRLKYMLVEWRSFCPSSDYRQIMEDVLWIISHWKIDKLLINQSQKTSFPWQETTWAYYEWLPKLAEIMGVFGKMAVVLSEKQQSQFIAPTPYKIGVANGMFNSLAEAECWLSEVIC